MCRTASNVLARLEPPARQERILRIGHLLLLGCEADHRSSVEGLVAAAECEEGLLTRLGAIEPGARRHRVLLAELVVQQAVS